MSVQNAKGEKMIKIFYGENRGAAIDAAKRILGDGYEVVEGETLAVEMMASVFLGMSLLSPKRVILIKDLGENKACFEELPKYLKTPHEVILVETKLDKRTAAYKELKDKVEIKEFAVAKNFDANVVFDVFGVAKRDGKKAVEMLEKIEDKQEPFMFVGLLVSQAIKDFNYRGGAKEKRVLEELSKLDMQMKTTSLQPWLLVKGFLLRISSL